MAVNADVTAALNRKPTSATRRGGVKAGAVLSRNTVMIRFDVGLLVNKDFLVIGGRVITTEATEKGNVREAHYNTSRNNGFP